MSTSRRLSQSLTGSWKEASGTYLQSYSPKSSILPLDSDSEEWVATWRTLFARDLIDTRVVHTDAETSVEDACELLLAEDIPCLAVRAQTHLSETNSPASSESYKAGGLYHGLFDFADVNAFLTLAATRHTLLPEGIVGNTRVNDIITAAKGGRVPVHLVSNLSQKNPFTFLPHNATLVSLLEVFSKGTHRTLIQSSSDPNMFIGMVSDRGLLSWFDKYANETESFYKYLSNPIQHLPLPSLNLGYFTLNNSGSSGLGSHSTSPSTSNFGSSTSPSLSANGYSASASPTLTGFASTGIGVGSASGKSIIASTSSATTLDAMRLMSEQGVSSVAVVEENSGNLLSAVSVTDIGKVVVPSQSNQILTMPLHHLISQIKEPEGLTDGAEKYPVYSVFPSSLLSYTIEKLLATNAHRVFVTRESGPASPTLSPSHKSNILGVVSIVDILSLFAYTAKIPNIDPTSMQRHRRASSVSSQTSDKELFLLNPRSRSNSRTSVGGVNISPIISGVNSGAACTSANLSRSPSITGISQPQAVSGGDGVSGIVGSPPGFVDPLESLVNLQRKASRRSVGSKRDSWGVRERKGEGGGGC